MAAKLRKDVPDLRSASFKFITAIRSLLRAEMRLGLERLAGEHAAMFVEDDVFHYHERSTSGESAFEILFGPDAAAGEALFHALRRKKIPGEEGGSTMNRVRDLLAGKASPAAIDEALRALPNEEEADAIRGQYRQHQSQVPSWSLDRSFRLARAAVCRAAGRDADAEAAYKQSAELVSDGLIAAPGRGYLACRTRIGRSWNGGNSSSIAADTRNRPRGCSTDGSAFRNIRFCSSSPVRRLSWPGTRRKVARRMELSHWVALGQERVRGKFLDELVRRGEATAAKREIDLVLRGCWCRDHYFGNVMNQAAQAAVLNRDFAAAEKCRQRSLLVILRTPDVFFVELSAYMNVPHDLLVYRARAQPRGGKVR